MISRSNIFTLLKKNKWNNIIKRCKKNPKEAQAINDAGWLPLHLACYKNAPLNVIQALYEAHPDSITCKTNIGWLPINIASVGIASQDIIDYLRKISKDHASTVASDNETPIAELNTSLISKQKTSFHLR